MKKLKYIMNETGSKGRGRPRVVELSDSLKLELQELYLSTNRSTLKGSMTVAWLTFVQRHPEFAIERGSKHSLPTAAIEAMKQAERHVRHHRQGARKAREVAENVGGMRWNALKNRRLYAGEQCSWDDATVNFGVVVPWPQGGCPCSDRYGVKIGRFQLLLCHDDATSFVPCWSYVVREKQGYRGEDVAGLMLRCMRDVAVYDRFIVEGGVWQSKRILSILERHNVQLVDAKGRPQQKLVEGYFNKLWTQLSVELPHAQVGRWRGEEKATSELYVACRAGRKDPRQYFPTLSGALDAIERAIVTLNARVVESQRYGTWVPEARWMDDLVHAPKPRLTGEWLWQAAPVVVERKVTKGSIRVTADGVMGLRQKWYFSAPWLYAHQGKEIVLYFDPRATAPVTGMVTDKAGKVLGEAQCVNPVYSGGSGEDIAKQLREALLREYRVMRAGGVDRKVTEIKIADESVVIEQADNAREPLAQKAMPEPVRGNSLPRLNTKPDAKERVAVRESMRRRATEARKTHQEGALNW